LLIGFPFALSGAFALHFTLEQRLRGFRGLVWGLRLGVAVVGAEMAEVVLESQSGRICWVVQRALDRLMLRGWTVTV